MGYPLKFSPVYSLIKDLLSLQKTLRSGENGEILFEHDEVQNILSNSFFNESRHENSSITDDVSSNKDLWIPSSFFNEKPPFDFIFRKVDTAKDPRKNNLDIWRFSKHHKFGMIA